MGKLRKNLEAAIAALQAAETTFQSAKAGADRARTAASATDMLKTFAEKESAVDLILERAADVEAALDAYRKQLELDYHNEMQAATVRSRALNEKRQELMAALADVDEQIARAAEAERPAVDAAVSRESFGSQYARYASTCTVDAVRSTQSVAAA